MSTNENEDGRNPLDEPPSFKLDSIKTFRPLHSIDSGLWRKSLQTVRGRFAEAANSSDRLTCVLTQSAVPAWPKEDEPPKPSETAGMEPVAIGTGPRREPVQIFERIENGHSVLDTEFGKDFKSGWDMVIIDIKGGFRSKDGAITYRPAVGDKAVFNVDGKPMLYRDGKPVAIRLGLGRTYMIYADCSDPERHKLCQRFNSTRNRSGPNSAWPAGRSESCPLV